MGVNAFIISVHKDFSDHSEFMLRLRLEMGEFIDDARTVLVGLKGEERMKPLHLRCLTQVKQDITQESRERRPVLRACLIANTPAETLLETYRRSRDFKVNTGHAAATSPTSQNSLAFHLR